MKTLLLSHISTVNQTLPSYPFILLNIGTRSALLELLTKFREIDG
jgi:hypothetical protein